jgi:hypothetical protein
VRDRSNHAYWPERLSVLTPKHRGNNWEPNLLERPASRGSSNQEVTSTLLGYGFPERLLLKRVQREPREIILGTGTKRYR